MKQIEIGWAQIDITPARPVYNYGQIYTRVSQYVHDPLTATALALDNGEEHMVFVSMDMTEPPSQAVQDMVREGLSALEGFDPEKLILSATHTHNAYFTEHSLWDADDIRLLGGEQVLPELDVPGDIMTEQDVATFLAARITEVVEQAWLQRKPGGLASASDYAAVGFNRRPVFKTSGGEESVMYGVCAQDSFLRYEGGTDHAADMLYTFDEKNALTGVAVCIPCPSQVFELHSFITADYWHYARNSIRESLGDALYVLPMCGAAGDQNPLDLTRISKTNKKTLVQWNAQAGEVFRNFDMTQECELIGERIAEAVSRGHKQARNRIAGKPTLAHRVDLLQMPIRKVEEADYLEAMERIRRQQSAFSPEHRMTGVDEVAAFEPLGIIKRWNQQHKSPLVNVQSRTIRVGDMAICTCPFELFVEYSLRIKARAKSPKTWVVQLTDDIMGYLPTRAAIAGGSYSSKPASTTVGPDSGDQLVEHAIATIEAFFTE